MRTKAPNTKLSKADIALVEEAKLYLHTRYKRGVHHAACVLRCGSDTYRGLHLDVSGFDVCAEVAALGSALADGQTTFDTIVTVLHTPRGITVVNPCGNCRQMLLDFAPKSRVIVADKKGLRASTPAALLPIPYSKAPAAPQGRRG
jgi:cytidine deaminase